MATFIVSSEVERFRGLARRPYRHVHVHRTDLSDTSLRRLASSAYRVLPARRAGEVASASSATTRLAHDVPCTIARCLSEALAGTAIADDLPGLVEDLQVDLLTCRGANYHNDTSWEWSASLFWVVVLDAADVEFASPQAKGFRQALRPNDLIVFDASLPHAVCRPCDLGHMRPSRFGERKVRAKQAFLAGELRLTRAQWAKLGSPWRKLPAARNVIDLHAVDFDPGTGAVALSTG